MTEKNLISPLVLLFMGISLITNCRNNGSDKNDSQTMQREVKQEQQILRERSDTTTSESPIFETTLNGTNEAKDDTEASGSVTLTLQGDSIHIKGQFFGLSSEYTASYIHQALESDRIQPLDPAVNSDSTSGSWESSYKLDKGGISMLKKDSLYISVYSTGYESGELRGQLTLKEEDQVND